MIYFCGKMIYDREKIVHVFIGVRRPCTSHFSQSTLSVRSHKVVAVVIISVVGGGRLCSRTNAAFVSVFAVAIFTDTIAVFDARISTVTQNERIHVQSFGRKVDRGRYFRAVQSVSKFKSTEMNHKHVR